MIVHRFMSDIEYKSLLAGDTLTNTTVHKDNGRNSTSVGFCFFIEKPEEAVHWLSFVADSLDWCVTFDIPDQMLTKSRARYRDPERDNWPLDKPATIWRTEWCLQQYSIHKTHVVDATNQYADYEENMEKELVNHLGPLGELLLMMI